MTKTAFFSRCALIGVAVLLNSFSIQAQTTVLTEDFSGETNIFGVTATTLANSSAVVYDSGLEGFGKVLAVSNATADGTIANEGSAIAADGSAVTVEWDAFHGYYAYDTKTTVSLLNSDSAVIASYVYNANGCKVISAVIGANDVSFDAFSIQSKSSGSSANGWGGNGRPFVGTAGNNPHVAVTLSSKGGVTMVFTLAGSTMATLLGNVGELKKDIAKMRVTNSFSRGENTDRCYGLDNIKVTTVEEAAVDPDYVESIVRASISGDERMTFGPSTDAAHENPYTVVITGSDGTTITEENLSDKVTDFSVTWDIDGFKTVNDTEGQYCDSYGAFSVNGEGKVSTTFDLRDVPMNFFGHMTATITYNGTTVTAGKYVVAQGDLSRKATQVLPLAGYPVSFSGYPAALDGYQVLKDTYGTGNDLIVGGWSVAGSDNATATLASDADGTRYVRLTANTLKKSHVLTQQIDTPTGQLIFATKLRFNAAGAVVTLTGGYPFWSSSKYTCPVSLSYDGTSLKLNDTAVALADIPAVVATGTWYQIVLSADKSSETCYALLYDAAGNLLGQSGTLPWAETSDPTFFSIGMGNSNTGSVDMAACEAFTPIVDTDSYQLTSDKTTLSIPQNETARLAVAINDENGYPVTGLATWSIVEDNMRESVVITPDAANSHLATVAVSAAAEAGTVTIQVSIGGVVKTLAMTLTTSAESIKFTESTTSITIPLDEGETATAAFAAEVVDGEGNATESTVTLSAYNRDGTTPFENTDGIVFDTATGLLTVTAAAQPTVLTIRATGQNSDGEELTKSISVNIHGMKFDFGYGSDESIAEGYTVVTATTAYTEANGYGIVSGTPAIGGTENAADAAGDYLSGAFGFSFKVQQGAFYTVEITYQGVLTTGYINSDLAGYELGTQTELTTVEYTIPATTDVIDLRVAANGDISEARIARIVVTKQAPRQKRAKRVVHHIGDSTSANNGSWAYRLSKSADTYPQLFDLCDFQNRGAGGRNLSTYYTQGKLASVLRDIYPDDIVMFGNNGTNGMGSSYEADMNYYLNAAEALGAQIIINSYTPHGAVSNYSNGYNATTNTFDSYRRDSYETIVRRVAEERAANDDNYLGFVEIGKNADAIFNAYVNDYAANGYASRDAAAKAIIACFTDHNHYSNGTLACDLMLRGYGEVKGIVQQLIDLLTVKSEEPEEVVVGMGKGLTVGITDGTAVYTLSGQRVHTAKRPGLYIISGRKVVVK